MHKLRLAILLSLAFVIPGCDGDENTGPDIKSLLLSLSKNKIVADGTDYAKVTVKDQNGMDITPSVTIYQNDEILTFNKIVSTTPSTSTIYASYENIESNDVQYLYGAVPVGEKGEGGNDGNGCFISSMMFDVR